MAFLISKKRCNQLGQTLLIVKKDGKVDRGGNAYVMQQVPEDFADYLLFLQEKHATENAELAELIKNATVAKSNEV